MQQINAIAFLKLLVWQISTFRTNDQIEMLSSCLHFRMPVYLAPCFLAGSFKIRGVINQLESILHSGELNHKQLVTISAGNYGKAFAYYLQKAGLVGTCIVPLTAAESNVLLLKVGTQFRLIFILVVFFPIIVLLWFLFTLWYLNIHSMLVSYCILRKASWYN